MNFRQDPEPSYVPPLGALVADTATGRLGVVRGWDGRRVTLASGGDEWTTDQFRPPTTGEALRVRVAEENRESLNRAVRRW